MSLYTHIYLQEKDRNNTYNETAGKSYGCVLFFLDTTPSRQLEVLPYSEDARLLSKETLEEILLYYDERIQSVNHKIAELKTQIDFLEKRILMVNPKLYDRINRDIEDYKDYIAEEQASLASLEYFYNKFMFVKNIIDNPDNSDYEIIYTKC